MAVMTYRHRKTKAQKQIYSNPETEVHKKTMFKYKISKTNTPLQPRVQAY